MKHNHANKAIAMLDTNTKNRGDSRLVYRCHFFQGRCRLSCYMGVIKNCHNRTNLASRWQLFCQPECRHTKLSSGYRCWFIKESNRVGAGSFWSCAPVDTFFSPSPREAINASGKTKWKTRRRRAMRAAVGERGVVRAFELSADAKVRKNNETRGKPLQMRDTAVRWDKVRRHGVMKTAEARRRCQKFPVRVGGFSLIVWQTETAEWSSAPFFLKKILSIEQKLSNGVHQNAGQKSRRLWEHLLFHPLRNIPGRCSVVFIVVEEFPLPRKRQKKRHIWNILLSKKFLSSVSSLKASIAWKIK